MKFGETSPTQMDDLLRMLPEISAWKDLLEEFRENTQSLEYFERDLKMKVEGKLNKKITIILI